MPGLPALDTTKRGCVACLPEYRMDHPAFLRYRGRWYCPAHWVAAHPGEEQRLANERLYRAVRDHPWCAHAASEASRALS